MKLARLLLQTSVAALVGLNCFAAPIQINGNVTILFHDLTDTVTVEFLPNNPGFLPSTSGESATVTAMLLNVSLNLTNTVALTEGEGGPISDFVTLTMRAIAGTMNSTFELDFHSDPLTAPSSIDLRIPEDGTPQTPLSIAAGPNLGDSITVKAESDACDVEGQSPSRGPLTCPADTPEPSSAASCLLGLALVASLVVRSRLSKRGAF